MSVNAVFGENLRLLARERGSLVKVAEDLGISRVQFQRYLRGESFPKPSLLHRICGYFGVDGRILLEPLAKLAAPPGPGVLPPPMPVGDVQPHISALLGWCLRGHDYHLPQSRLPDGLYRCWVAEVSRHDTYYCMELQVSSKLGPRGETLPLGRTTRSYFDRSMFTGGQDGATKSRREVRGALFGLPDSFVWLAFNPAPIYRITFAHFAPNPVVADGSFVGFVARGRVELPGHTRVARAFLEPVPRNMRAIMAMCRTKAVYSAKDVPETILEVIRRPVEWRSGPFG